MGYESFQYLNPLYSSFSPRDIPSLKVWLKADVGTYQNSTMTIPAVIDADPVGGWADQSGNGNHLINAAATVPQLKLNVINGKPVVRFDGANDFLRVTFGAALTQPNHIFMVGIQISWTNNDSMFDGATANKQRLYSRVATPTVTMYAGANGPTSASWTLGAAMLLECLYNSVNSTFIINNGIAATGNPNPNTMDGLTLGDTGAPGNVDICEFLVYDAEITGSNLANLRAYLNWKW
jgi:hypothetical protein